MNDILVIGPGASSGQITILMGPVSTTGLVELIQEKDMYGRSTMFDYGLAARDKKIADVRRRLSLAHLSRNKGEVTRLTRELTYLGQSW